jgi:hypothetical protein
MLPRDPRLIDVCWPDWDRPLPPADGLVVAIAGTDAPTAWADEILHRGEDGFVLWAATGSRPGPVITSVLARRSVRAVALAPASADPRQVQAALQLARRLSNHAEPGQPTHPSVTSPSPPEGIGGELVAVPHLVTLHTPEGFEADTVFWVLLPLEEAVSHFAIPAPGTGKAAPDRTLPTLGVAAASADGSPSGRSTTPTAD